MLTLLNAFAVVQFLQLLWLGFLAAMAVLVQSKHGRMGLEFWCIACLDRAGKPITTSEPQKKRKFQHNWRKVELQHEELQMRCFGLAARALCCAERVLGERQHLTRGGGGREEGQLARSSSMFALQVPFHCCRLPDAPGGHAA